MACHVITHPVGGGSKMRAAREGVQPNDTAKRLTSGRGWRVARTEKEECDAAIILLGVRPQSQVRLA